MKKIKSERLCPKCGNSQLYIMYSEQSNLLNIRCRTCDYFWQEVPCDAKEQTK